MQWRVARHRNVVQWTAGVKSKNKLYLLVNSQGYWNFHHLACLASGKGRVVNASCRRIELEKWQKKPGDWVKGLFVSSSACEESVNIIPEIKHLLTDPNEILNIILALYNSSIRGNPPPLPNSLIQSFTWTRGNSLSQRWERTFRTQSLDA